MLPVKAKKIIAVLITAFVLLGAWRYVVFIQKKLDNLHTIQTPQNQNVITEDPPVVPALPDDISDNALSQDLAFANSSFAEIEAGLSEIETEFAWSDSVSLPNIENLTASAITAEAKEKISRALQNLRLALVKIELIKNISQEQQNYLSDSAQQKITELNELKQKIEILQNNKASAVIEYRKTEKILKSSSHLSSQILILSTSEKIIFLSEFMGATENKIKIRLTELNSQNLIAIKNLLLELVKEKEGAKVQAEPLLKDAFGDVEFKTILLRLNSAKNSLFSAKEKTASLINYILQNSL